MKTNTQKNPTPTHSLYPIYRFISTVVTEEAHRIYRMLSCSDSFKITVLDTRLSALLPLISRDPLYEHN